MTPLGLQQQLSCHCLGAHLSLNLCRVSCFFLLCSPTASRPVLKSLPFTCSRSCLERQRKRQAAVVSVESSVHANLLPHCSWHPTAFCQIEASYQLLIFVSSPISFLQASLSHHGSHASWGCLTLVQCILDSSCSSDHPEPSSQQHLT